MEIKHALIAVIMGDGDLEISHFCGYKDKPTKNDRDALIKRLQTIPEYNLVDVKGWEIQEASSALIKYYLNLDPKDEDSYYMDGDTVKRL